MPYSVKGVFEINEDMVQILLMLEVLFTQDSKVEDLFCGASSGSEPSLFFSNYFFSLGFQPVQDDFQHNFAQMTDEADSSVVLAELQVAFFRECNNQRLSPWGRPGRVAQSVGHRTRKSGVPGSIPGLTTYFRFSFRFFKKGSCQLLAKVCARSTG